MNDESKLKISINSSNQNTIQNDVETIKSSKIIKKGGYNNKLNENINMNLNSFISVAEDNSKQISSIISDKEGIRSKLNLKNIINNKPDSIMSNKNVRTNVSSITSNRSNKSNNSKNNLNIQDYKGNYNDINAIAKDDFKNKNRNKSNNSNLTKNALKSGSNREKSIKSNKSNSSDNSKMSYLEEKNSKYIINTVMTNIINDIKGSTDKDLYLRLKNIAISKSKIIDEDSLYLLYLIKIKILENEKLKEKIKNQEMNFSEIKMKYEELKRSFQISITKIQELESADEINKKQILFLKGLSKSTSKKNQDLDKSRLNTEMGLNELTNILENVNFLKKGSEEIYELINKHMSSSSFNGNSKLKENNEDNNLKASQLMDKNHSYINEDSINFYKNNLFLHLKEKSENLNLSFKNTSKINNNLNNSYNSQKSSHSSNNSKSKSKSQKSNSKNKNQNNSAYKQNYITNLQKNNKNLNSFNSHAKRFIDNNDKNNFANITNKNSENFNLSEDSILLKHLNNNEDDTIKYLKSGKDTIFSDNDYLSFSNQGFYEINNKISSPNNKKQEKNETISDKISKSTTFNNKEKFLTNNKKSNIKGSLNDMIKKIY